MLTIQPRKSTYERLSFKKEKKQRGHKWHSHFTKNVFIDSKSHANMISPSLFTSLMFASPNSSHLLWKSSLSTGVDVYPVQTQHKDKNEVTAVLVKRFCSGGNTEESMEEYYKRKKQRETATLRSGNDKQKSQIPAFFKSTFHNSNIKYWKCLEWNENAWSHQMM